MELGQVIRKYRKKKNLTQEEMAARLGVSAPAVNKWENGNSMPDIMMLAPIARLLGITTDELLSFSEELTEKEIKDIVDEADRRLKEQSFEEAFCWARQIIERYPNCEMLIWQIAVIFDARRMMKEVQDEEIYDPIICAWYQRALESRDETVRQRSADSLFSFYLRKNEYKKAEECLRFFSEQNPEKKRKQAQIYSAANQIRKAYQAYEELLFADYQMINATLQGLYLLALQENNFEKAHLFADKQSEAARCFDMGRYHEAASQLEIATLEKDADTVLSIMEEMLGSVNDINSFTKSPLYEHMKFKDVNEDFLNELKNNLRQCFQDEETYGFLRKEEK
ncbi:helix-turn-helix domain-containing protein [Blautia sp. HCP3S3_G3]|uniref:helix-turn-helix domain-containing protein n=1 Tax=Blautia sp. HCP3S3_G3 TaxID=3438913 RepID=UPI003F8B213E